MSDENEVFNKNEIFTPHVEGVLETYPEIGDRPKRFYRTLQTVRSNPQKALSNPHLAPDMVLLNAK